MTMQEQHDTHKMSECPMHAVIFASAGAPLECVTDQDATDLKWTPPPRLASDPRWTPTAPQKKIKHWMDESFPAYLWNDLR